MTETRKKLKFIAEWEILLKSGANFFFVMRKSDEGWEVRFLFF